MSEVHLTDWGGPTPAQWSIYADGRVHVFMRDMEVRFPPAKVIFGLARSFGDQKLDYFYPKFIWAPPIEPPSPWASCQCGPLSPANAIDRTWFYPTADGRRWVGTAWIEPTGVTFTPSDELLPLVLPSDAEIASDGKKYRKMLRLDDGVPIDVHPHAQMVRDLAKSETLMEMVGDDTFGVDFHMFVLHNDFIHKPTGKKVDFSSDNDTPWMLSVLRRYGEHWQDIAHLPGSGLGNRAVIERLFSEVGYEVYNLPVDEDVRLDRLRRIGTSIPRSILEYIISRPEISAAIQLAWAIGHFWSEDAGWTEPKLPLSSEEYGSLQGGHLPDAAEILTMLSDGEIKLT